MGNPTRILMMAMAVASGNAFIVSPKAQLVARRTLPHARAMPIVAAFSKIEGEAKDTEVCPRLRHVASSLRPARARGPPPPPSPPAPPPMPHPRRAAASCHPPHDTTVHAFTAHPQLSPLLPAQCSRLCPRRHSNLWTGGSTGWSHLMTSGSPPASPCSSGTTLSKIRPASGSTQCSPCASCTSRSL